MHLSEFKQIYDTIKMNGVLDDVIYLKLFPYRFRRRHVVNWGPSLLVILTLGRNCRRNYFLDSFP